ncbi:MAG: YMGG-like glycine zipper-containing protein [Thermoanaerobaculia bacterium]
MSADDTYTTKGKTTTAAIENEAREEANHDPITGETGSHPVGTGVGALGGAAAGAAVGVAVGGPVGAMIGAAVGGVAGGLAGKEIAESVNPTEEEAYWRESYSSRPYAANRGYDELGPAYQYGWETWSKHRERGWNGVEGELEQGWNAARGSSRLPWNEARHASRDAWDRLDSRYRAGDRPAR